MRTPAHEATNMNRLGKWLWWMDREDPRFASSLGAKLAYAIVWALGFLFLLVFAQLMLYLLNRFGLVRIGS
jgi:hypothetical protein